MARSDNILGRVMTPDTPDTPADGEGGWADVQHTDPFFSLPTPNPADGQALAVPAPGCAKYVTY